MWLLKRGTRQNNDHVCFESSRRTGHVFPIYPGMVPDTIFVTLEIASLRSLDVNRHHERECEPYHDGAILHLVYVYFSLFVAVFLIKVGPRNHRLEF